MLKDVKELYQMTQDELYDYVKDFLSGRDEFEITQNRDGYIVCFPKDIKSPIPVLSSHLDTVGSVPPDEIVESDGKYTAKKCGYPCVLGGDDRNGVWTMLKLIKKGESSWGYIFSRDEEIGRLGADKLVNSGFFEEHKQEIGYFLAIDRKGKNDLAYYRYYVNGRMHNTKDNDAFIAGLQKLKGYSFQRGSATDITNFCEATKLCGINISSGYFMPHSSYEYTDIAYLQRLPEIVKDLISHLGYKQYKVAI